MSRRFEIEDGNGRRFVEAGQFPLAIGGSDGDLRLEKLPETVAWLGLDAGDLFLQPVENHGSPGAKESQWLEVGKEISLAGMLLSLESGESGARIRLTEGRRKKAPTLIPPPRSGKAQGAPASAPAPAAAAEPAAGASGRPIEPILFEPARDAGPPTTRSVGRRLVFGVALLLLLGVLAGLAFFLFSARSVALRFEPGADQVEIRGTWPSPQAGGRYLLLPGEYTVLASKTGYRPLQESLLIGSEARQEHIFELHKEPGILRLNFYSGDAASNAENPSLDSAELKLLVDAQEVVDSVTTGHGKNRLELEAGAHRLRVEAPRHRPFETEITIAGSSEEQTLDVALEPLWATLQFESKPAGARLRIDGEDRGRTPVSLEVLEGTRVYTLSLAGHGPRRGSLDVVARQDRRVGPIELRPSAGNLSLTSQPEGASVRVDGAYRGQTPTSLELAPGQEYLLRFEKLGHRAEQRRVSLDSGEAKDLHVELQEERGTLSLEVFPSDATVLLNDVEISARRFELAAARPHRLEVKREGYLPQTRELTALAGHEQSLEIRLETREEAKEKKIQRLDRTSEGQELKLIEPGRLRMGASRRESGRRANEILREIELTRRFHISAHEITNAEFKRFRPGHRSGVMGGESLDLDRQPVVRITWQDAAAYCNWLSEKEGLEPAYVKEGEILVPKSFEKTPPSGYRLPTEAEWAWVARYPARAPGAALDYSPLKYPWGPSLPVPPKAGNFADADAADIVSAHLGEYRDGFPATAPVDAFPANSRGIYQLGGNVAEWVHDVYVVRPVMPGAIERDPQGPQSGDFHVIRGSSWMHSTVTELRLSFRDYGKDPRSDVGFRIARPVL